MGLGVRQSRTPRTGGSATRRPERDRPEGRVTLPDAAKETPPAKRPAATGAIAKGALRYLRISKRRSRSRYDSGFVVLT